MRVLFLRYAYTDFIRPTCDHLVRSFGARRLLSAGLSPCQSPTEFLFVLEILANQKVADKHKVNSYERATTNTKNGSAYAAI